MESTETEVCYRHADRPTGRHCTRCGNAACWECLVPASVGSHCLSCVKDQRQGQAPLAVQRTLQTPQLITIVLIGINVLAFLYAQSRGLNPTIQDLGLFGPSVADGEAYRLVTSGFLHGGFLHLGMNMFALWNLGQAMESSLGPARFTGAYFASMLGGSAGALLVDAATNELSLTVGASGAVFGLLGVLAANLHQRGINVLQTSIGQVLIINLLFTFAMPRISVGGHIGGLVAGGAVGLALSSTKVPPRQQLWAIGAIGLAGIAIAWLAAVAT